MSAQRLSRELNVDLLINQAGYAPGAGKTVVTKGLINRNYDVIRLEDQRVVFEGRFTPNTCDFGDYSTGDFSALTQEGHYYIKSDTVRSWPFRISKTAYRTPMRLIVDYFSQRNCFGIIPYGLYAAEEPGGNRKVDNFGAGLLWLPKDFR